MIKIFVFVGSLFLFTGCATKKYADIILDHGRIYSMLAESDTSESIAILDGKILAVGTAESINKYRGPETQIIDLHGLTVLPGFTDAHIHPISGGLALLECDLSNLTNQHEIIDSIKNFAKSNQDRTWIRGESMWLSAFQDGNPMKFTLDSIVPERPAFISSSDGHNAWVNSKALELAGISRETADPLNGRIERDPHTKEPTGTLREAAQDLITQLLPKYTSEERIQALEKAMMLANQNGLTSLVEASASPEYIETYQALEKKNKLTAHINISIYGDISHGSKTVEEVIRIKEIISKTREISNTIR
jgi:predicted amidohydrolase YtcJ